MGRNQIAPYPDVVPTHPELSLEEIREQIERMDKEDEKLTEWPDI